jgi:hypothetical protein
MILHTAYGAFDSLFTAGVGVKDRMRDHSASEPQAEGAHRYRFANY